MVPRAWRSCSWIGRCVRLCSAGRPVDRPGGCLCGLRRLVRRRAPARRRLDGGDAPAARAPAARAPAAGHRRPGTGGTGGTGGTAAPPPSRHRQRRRRRWQARGPGAQPCCSRWSIAFTRAGWPPRRSPTWTATASARSCSPATDRLLVFDATGAPKWQATAGRPHLGLAGDRRLRRRRPAGGGGRLPRQRRSCSTPPGRRSPGFPVAWRDELRSLAAGDVDGDGRLEIVVATTSLLRAGALSDVFRSSAATAASSAGFPANTSGTSGCAATCYLAGAFDQNLALGPLDGDGGWDIVVPHDNAYICWHKGSGVAFDSAAHLPGAAQGAGHPLPARLRPGPAGLLRRRRRQPGPLHQQRAGHRRPGRRRAQRDRRAGVGAERGPGRSPAGRGAVAGEPRRHPAGGLDRTVPRPALPGRPGRLRRARTSPPPPTRWRWPSWIRRGPDRSWCSPASTGRCTRSAPAAARCGACATPPRATS